ncbi:restriction endonuclease subunit S [Cylindrospermum sp. FACHB-282]|uniref:restriction endonuclease subunit S n=1 Tax=Cylindrospermum sp. FACHB-282 TaxID=2692794 RepID=UPI0016876C37|nr:restriction endonuclease subunit S [Cylindrospermum sp. FACHB-282]MBD2388731.1 restriction endonuclease subunit S [Cylindrospermum sp. FACHB-282]
MVVSGWKKIPLGDVLKLQRGFDLPHTKRQPGDIPVVSSSGISGQHSEAKAKSPGVVTGRYGTIGEVFFISEDFWPLNTTLFVKDFKGNNPLFISFLLRTIDFKSCSDKSGVPGVNRNDLHNLEVKLPPLPEQKTIAQSLSDVDALITECDRIITKKRNTKQGTMQQLLTGKKRLPGFSGEWEVKKLGEIGEFKNGINKGKEDFGFGYPFVNLLDVFGRSKIFQGVSFGLVNSSGAERKIYELRKGDILFIRSSVKPEGVGLTSVVNDDLEDTVYSGFLIRFRDFGELDFEYKVHCFNEEEFRKRVIDSSTVSANTNINQDALKNLQITLPPTIEEQKAIAQILSDMDAEIAALEQKRDKYKAIKQGMMQELLTGKTRLEYDLDN